jgi:hypothetical protein
MTAFRSRSTLAIRTLLGTVVSISLSGLAWAQSPADSWPFNEEHPAPPKSAVQQRLEALYRRDGRPLPDYLQRGSSSSRAEPAEPTPAAGGVSAQRNQRDGATSQGTVRQQLSGYYQNQVKAMPGQPKQANLSRPAQSSWYDRINPFHHPGSFRGDLDLRRVPQPADTSQSSAPLWLDLGSSNKVVPIASKVPSSASVGAAPGLPAIGYVRVAAPATAARATVAPAIVTPAVVAPAVVAPAVVTVDPHAPAEDAHQVSAALERDDPLMPFRASSEAEADQKTGTGPYTGLTLEDGAGPPACRPRANRGTGTRKQAPSPCDQATGRELAGTFVDAERR